MKIFLTPPNAWGALKKPFLASLCVSTILSLAILSLAILFDNSEKWASIALEAITNQLALTLYKVTLYSCLVILPTFLAMRMSPWPFDHGPIVDRMARYFRRCGAGIANLNLSLTAIALGALIPLAFLAFREGTWLYVPPVMGVLVCSMLFVWFMASWTFYDDSNSWLNGLGLNSSTFKTKERAVLSMLLLLFPIVATVGLFVEKWPEVPYVREE